MENTTRIVAPSEIYCARTSYYFFLDASLIFVEEYVETCDIGMRTYRYKCERHQRLRHLVFNLGRANCFFRLRLRCTRTYTYSV